MHRQDMTTPSVQWPYTYIWANVCVTLLPLVPHTPTLLRQCMHLRQLECNKAHSKQVVPRHGLKYSPSFVVCCAHLLTAIHKQHAYRACEHVAMALSKKV